MWNSPGFLDLPDRAGKPRDRGLTHVLDKGTAITALDALLVQAGHLIDVIKIGWGIAYIDPMVKERVALCHAAGVMVSLGGTLLEVAAAQDRLTELRHWAAGIGVDALEVSNGLGALTPQRKAALIHDLSDEFVVLAETGLKSGTVPVVTRAWLAEMEADLAAGARWLIAEGRESGTVGLYEPDGSVRAALVEAIAAHLPVEQVIFEAPRAAQQSWMVRHLGADVSLGNVPPEEVLPLETLRLGLRADTARLPNCDPTDQDPTDQDLTERDRSAAPR
ncbi:MAG: phosphosulfolactate synthase [Pseudonocardiaceae bacterium]